MSTLQNYVDPLREPTNARSRLRQQRQQESAAKYDATYDRRVLGALSTVRQQNGTKLQTQSFKPHGADVSTVLAPGASTTKPQQVCAKTTIGAPAMTTTVPRDAMCGHHVNVYGQTIDGKEPAITRLLHGDFYTVRGPAVDDLAARKEGKFMRFRAQSADIAKKAIHDATTMTAPPNGQQPPMLKHSHGHSPEKHHCHHGHRGTHSPSRGDLGVLPNHWHHDTLIPHPMSHHHFDHMVGSSVPIQFDAATETDDSPLVSNRKNYPRPSTARNATYSSHQKVRTAHDVALQQHNAANTPRPATARQASAKRAVYETALSHQKSKPPGEASVLSESDYNKILQLTTARPPTNFERPTSAAPYRPKDKKGIIS